MGRNRAISERDPALANARGRTRGEVDLGELMGAL